MLPKNPYLALPPSAQPLVAAAGAPFADAGCRPLVLISHEAEFAGRDALRYALLAAAPAFLEPDRILCEAADTVAAVFASETWRAGLTHLARLAIAEDAQRNDPALYVRFIDTEIRHLARTIIVIRLHAGTLTTEGAESYLVETARLNREDASREVLDASVSPGLAWPGIASILVERMVDRIAEPSGSRKPRAEARRLLEKERGLPLALIEREIAPQ
jgi:hypothetical protein